MRLRYSDAAKADIAGIRSYYSQFGEGPLVNVLKDIRDTLRAIRTFPTSGRKIRPEHFRLITKKYRYVIIYRIDREGSQDVVTVHGVIRHQDHPLNRLPPE